MMQQSTPFVCRRAVVQTLPRGARATVCSADASGTSSGQSGARLAPTSAVAIRAYATGKSWLPAGQELEKAVARSMVHTLVQEHTAIADQVVPWYMANFPKSYFLDVGESTRTEHLKGLTALKSIDKASNQNISLTLTSKADDQPYTEITMMRTSSTPGTLHKMLRTMEMTPDSVLHRVKAYTSVDESMTLNIFTYGPAGEEPPAATAEDAAVLLKEAVGKPRSSSIAGTDVTLTREELLDYVKLCQPNYVRTTTTHQFLVQRDLYMRVAGTENVEVHVDNLVGEREDIPRNAVWVRIAASNTVPTDMLSKVTALLLLRGISIHRMHMDVVQDPTTQTGDRSGSVANIRVLVEPAAQSVLPKGVTSFQGLSSDLYAPAWRELKHELKRLKWLDDVVLDLALTKCPGIGMDRAEVIMALCSLLHGPLYKINQHAFSRSGMRDMVGDPLNRKHVLDIADLFIARFNPQAPLSNGKFKERADELRSRLQPIQDESSRKAFLLMVDAVEATLRTNLYVPERFALALRLDPKLLLSGEDQMKPFGAFFVCGHGFHGFHNRFSNIARGGLRIVTPGSRQQYVTESARCYDEAYALSRAQELKNKDIPEGGAKAVILVDTISNPTIDAYHTKRNAVKAFSDAILDLIVPHDEVRSKVVDHLGFEELVYLGPDEQVVPADIDWIIEHAKSRNYPMATAFMSSKPLAGFNHKEFGVTSEGVVVFLDTALRNAGIDPKSQPFTVKITGGPDGDVAGNLLKILFRDYGVNARIVGIADGSGCAEDPNGLPHDELLRLFHAGLPIADLSRDALSSTGILTTADTPEGVDLRNSMHNRVKADVFVPAGGRPNTIHAGNWRSFLDAETGKPSSPLIVEGANIFLTKEAREALHAEAGIAIVKDSSANKCGVITSSYEICCSMLLDEVEFLAIKEELVSDVLMRLRQLARQEAELMFREFQNYPGALPSISERISSCILRAKAAILEELQHMQRDDDVYKKLLQLFKDEHLPKKLVEVAGDRIDERIPLDYLRYAFASCLASKLLYKEGIHFLESQPVSKLPDLAMRYINEESKIEKLVQSIGASGNIPEDQRQEVMNLLRRGGVRSLLNVY